MKKIEVIVCLFCFECIWDVLVKIGVNFFMFMEVKGFGLQKGEKFMYCGSVYDLDYIVCLCVDIFCKLE